MGSRLMPAENRVGQHDCRLVAGADGFRDAALEYLADGLDRRDRVMYVADRAVEELTADLAPLGEIDEHLESGLLEIQSTLGLYTPGGTFDVDAQIDRYRRRTRAALEDGHRGLRVAADATALVATDASRRRFVHYEMAIGRLMAQAPMSAMCAYDEAVVGPAVAELCAVHQTDNAPAGISPRFRLCHDACHLHLRGEIDLANCEMFALALEAAVTSLEPGSDVVIDASGLEFIDVRGLAPLAELHGQLAAAGRRLRLLEPSPVLCRVAELVDLHFLIDADGDEVPS